MAEILTSLTSLAVKIFRERGQLLEQARHRFQDIHASPDLVLAQAIQTSRLWLYGNDAVKRFTASAIASPELSGIAPVEGALDPMVLHPGGGSRNSAEGIIASLFSASLFQMYLLGAPADESTYVRTVLEGFEELCRGLRGERVRSYVFTGLANVSISAGRQITTPWGVLRKAPAVEDDFRSMMFRQPRASCIFSEQRLVQVLFDRAPSPSLPADPSASQANRAAYLLPLACALASKDSANPAMPVIVWTTIALPFMAGTSFSWPLLGPSLGKIVNLDDCSTEVEEWSRIVDRTHVPSLDIAIRRLTSAIAHRMDRADALIDAVMVWENLVGTSTEVTFRVSASLAKLIERDPVKRRVLRKELSEIYAIRSRIVHGASVDGAETDEACKRAVDIAIRALRAGYGGKAEWLAANSSERSDEILLEWS